MPVVYSVQQEGTSPRWCAAFARGCGSRVVPHSQGLQPGPVAAFGSPRLWGLLQQARAQGRDWYYGDHGYFQRGRYYRCTRGAYMHDGRGQSDGRRLRAHGVRVQPWRRGGGHVLVCPPGEVFCGLHGMDAESWLGGTLNKLAAHTDRPVQVRAKSEARHRPLSVDLRDCWALVTFMSNTAVEAVLAGVPVFCTGQCTGLTMGRGDLSKIEEPAKPEGRRQWAAVLADQQWTLEEMSRGMLWRDMDS
jgi:hypothetical protein